MEFKKVNKISAQGLTTGPPRLYYLSLLDEAELRCADGKRCLARDVAETWIMQPHKFPYSTALCAVSLVDSKNDGLEQLMNAPNESLNQWNECI